METNQSDQLFHETNNERSLLKIYDVSRIFVHLCIVGKRAQSALSKAGTEG